MKRMLVLMLALAGPAAAGVPAYPPSQCAAFWHGFADVLGDHGERALAEGFLTVAERVEGAGAAAKVAEQRPLMATLVDAYVHDQDDQSRDLMDRLIAGCGELAADFPETQSR